MTDSHYDLVQEVDYYDIFGEELIINRCYICVYTYDEIITDDYVFHLDKQVIIFLCDSKACKLYCYGFFVEDNTFCYEY